MNLRRWTCAAGISLSMIAVVTLGTGCGKSQEPKAPKGEESVGKAGGTPMEIDVPLGLPPVKVPEDNPMTKEKVELGKMLYFDTRLSKSNKISCATCHDPKMAWTEHKPTSVGIHEQKGDRNSPTVINAAYMTSQFWDGREPTLEAQALGPIENPIEMGNKMDLVLDDLVKIDWYKKQFKLVFGVEKIENEHVAKAIAAFERTVLSGNSPYDKFEKGDKNALTDAQKRGLEVFTGKGSCSTCHTPPTFSNGQFYNAGIGMDKKEPDPGRKKVTGKDSDMGAFRVPHLREIAATYPYYHDGSVEKLEEAVAIMAEGGKDNKHLSTLFKAIKAAKLTDKDKKDLVAFLKALSGEYPKMDPPKLPS